MECEFVDSAPAAEVLRIVAKEMGIEEAKIEAYCKSLDKECIVSVEDLRMLEASHFRYLKIPDDLASRIRSRLKGEVNVYAAGSVQSTCPTPTLQPDSAVAASSSSTISPRGMFLFPDPIDKF